MLYAYYSFIPIVLNYLDVAELAATPIRKKRKGKKKKPQWNPPTRTTPKSKNILA